MTKATHSLVRPLPPQRVVELEAQPVDIAFDLSRTALIVIDMQNDFCHPQGWFGARGVSTDAAIALCPGINLLTRSLRAFNVPVIWLNWGVRGDRAELSETLIMRGGAFSGLPSYGDASSTGQGNILVEGSWGAELFEDIEAAPSDLVVHKNRLSGFWNTALDAILRNRQVTTLLFAGINTDRCVFSTLQDAGFLGYDCVLLSDLAATSSNSSVSEAAMQIITLLHGFTALGGQLATIMANAQQPFQTSPK